MQLCLLFCEKPRVRESLANADSRSVLWRPALTNLSSTWAPTAHAPKVSPNGFANIANPTSQ